MDSSTDSKNKLVFDNSYFKLKWYENPRLLRYIFSILLIATLVSIFELLFVYYISFPQTEKSVNELFPPVPETPPIFGQIEKAEKRDREAKNLYLIFNFMSVIFVMIFLLYVVYVKMEFDQRKTAVFGPNFRATVLQSLFSVLLLAAFQVFFFQFAKKTALTSDAELFLATSVGTLRAIDAELAKR